MRAQPKSTIVHKVIGDEGTVQVNYNTEKSRANNPIVLVYIYCNGH